MLVVSYNLEVVVIDHRVEHFASMTFSILKKDFSLITVQGPSSELEEILVPSSSRLLRQIYSVHQKYAQNRHQTVI